MYYFEDGTGSSVATDSSGFDNDATLYNMDPATAWDTVTLPDTQPYDGVLTFDGVDDYIMAPYDSSMNPVSNATLQYWVWVDTAMGADGGATGYICVRNSTVQSRCWADTLDEPGLVQVGIDFYFDGVGARVLWQLGRITKEEWHHVACVVDDVYIKLYIDGRLNNTTFAPGTELRQFAQPLYLGMWNTGGWYFKGKLDEFCLLDYAEEQSKLGYYRSIPLPPAITTTVLPYGYTYSDYMETITVSGGTPPYEFSVISGVLPNGLALDTATGVISGWSDVADNQNFTIQVEDSDGATNSWSYQLWIHDNPDTIALPKKGWNLVGTGSKDDMSYSGMYIVSGPTRKSLAEAEASGWIDSTLYYFDDGAAKAYQAVSNDTDILSWEHGYWLWTKQDNLYLILR
jgi:Concanavalin A-like lectin/glucanases superfamily/Putative Ig domain